MGDPEKNRENHEIPFAEAVENAQAEPHKYTVSETFKAVRDHLSQDERWSRLNWFQRRKLETAYTVGLLAQSTLRDMGDLPLLNAIVIAVPGPWGIPVGAGLALSYAFRWDKRGKEVRQKLGQMVREGVPLHEYEDVLIPHKKDPTREDIKDAALLAKKVKLIKDETVDSYAKLFHAAVKTYISGRDFTGEHTGNALRHGLKPVVGKEKADEIVNDAGKVYQSGEGVVSNAFNFCSRQVKDLKDLGITGLKATWNGAVYAGSATGHAVSSSVNWIGRKLHL